MDPLEVKVSTDIVPGRDPSYEAWYVVAFHQWAAVAVSHGVEISDSDYDWSTYSALGSDETCAGVVANGKSYLINLVDGVLTPERIHYEDETD